MLEAMDKQCPCLPMLPYPRTQSSLPSQHGQGMQPALRGHSLCVFWSFFPTGGNKAAQEHT